MSFMKNLVTLCLSVFFTLLTANNSYSDLKYISNVFYLLILDLKRPNYHHITMHYHSALMHYRMITL